MGPVAAYMLVVIPTGAQCWPCLIAGMCCPAGHYSRHARHHAYAAAAAHIFQRTICALFAASVTNYSRHYGTFVILHGMTRRYSAQEQG